MLNFVLHVACFLVACIFFILLLLAKGRTNLELREQFILADGVSQSLQPFKPKASPNSSQSSQSGNSSFNRSGMSLPATGPITKVCFSFFR